MKVNRQPGRMLLIAAALVMLAAACSRARPENVIIVSIDTLRQDALRAFHPGAAEHPGLDRFAARAVRFSAAVSPSSWTLPAHASLFTGRDPQHHGLNHPYQRLAGTMPTLASAFKQAGYETAAFTDGGYVDRSWGFLAGVDYCNEWHSPQVPPVALPRSGRPNQVHGAALFDRAIAFLRARPRPDQPLFLFLHTYVVHDYFKVHPWAAARLTKCDDPDERHYLGCLGGRHECSPAEWQRLEDLYAAELYRLDEGFAALRAALEARGMLSTTCIVFLSDHGEGFDYRNGRIHHGGRLHQDQLRIPLLISGPGIRPGASTDPVTLTDIMPTLLDLCGLDPVAGLDGRTFAPLLRGNRLAPDWSERCIYAMEYFYWWDNGTRLRSRSALPYPLQVGVIRANDWYITDRGQEALYDAAADAQQTMNLISETAPEKLARLRELVQQAVTCTSRPAPGPGPDAAMIKQLQSLGYLQDNGQKPAAREEQHPPATQPPGH